MYNFKNSKSNIINILKSTTNIEEKDSIPKNDNEFTYENGIMSWTSAIFIDIKDSSNLFNTRDEHLARLIRAFTSELITIFQDSDNYRQIGIRGDCVYAIYSTPYKNDIYDVFCIATKTNTFMRMFNEIIKGFDYNPIVAGIGLGCDKTLIVKAGRTGTGINDKIWIGKSVIDACNLASTANRNSYRPIAMSPLFYDNIIEKAKTEKQYSDDWFKPKKKNEYYDSHTIEFYHCDIIDTEFNTWINNGMRN